MYFYLQDNIVSSNFINRVNFSGIFPFTCGFEMLIAFLNMMHLVDSFFPGYTHLRMHYANQK